MQDKVCDIYCEFSTMHLHCDAMLSCLLVVFLTPTCLTLTLEYSLREDQPEGVLVENLFDVSNITWRYHNAHDTTTFNFLGSEHNQYFLLEESTGVLTTGPNTDRDLICDDTLECPLKLDVVVRIRSDGNIVNELINIWITLIDQNDHSPRFADTIVIKQITEMSPISSTISLPTANDEDVGVNDVKDYYLEQEDFSVFRLEVQTLANSLISIQLILLQELDAETKSEYELILVARDGGDPSRTGSTIVLVRVSDANDNQVRFQHDQYDDHINENLPSNTTILRVTATDADVGIYGKVTYSLSQSSQTSSLFSIDSESGVIYLIGQLDYETETVHHLIVEASDDPNGQPAVASVTIYVVDVNDNSPVITINVLPPGSDVARIQEHTRAGTVVAYIQVSDADSELNSDIRCNLDNSMFRMEALDGGSRYEVQTTMELDREIQDEHTMTVRCHDGGIASIQENQVILVEVIDSNDHDPIFNLSVYAADVLENMEIGTSITQVNIYNFNNTLSFLYEENN